MRTRKIPEPALPTLDQLEKARTCFEAYEPRDLFYRAATELVSLALQGKTELSVGEAIAVLLKSWNAQYYRFHGFNAQHFNAIDNVIAIHRAALDAYRSRSIISMNTEDSDTIGKLFKDFELVLGPVGAAKALHLLAPEFFPLWDREIAKGHGIYLANAGQNGSKYVDFMKIAVSKIQNVCPPSDLKTILKCIDELNYCRFTKGWI